MNHHYIPTVFEWLLWCRIVEVQCQLLICLLSRFLFFLSCFVSPKDGLNLKTLFLDTVITAVSNVRSFFAGNNYCGVFSSVFKTWRKISKFTHQQLMHEFCWRILAVYFVLLSCDGRLWRGNKYIYTQD